MDIVEIKRKIDTAEFGALVGLLESEQFDAKSGKYDLSSEAGKQELAKDVSSFANRSGGIIVFGAKTSGGSATFGETVSEVNLVPFDLINSSDYHNVINSWIYPRPEGVDICWVPSPQDSKRGLFYILVPNQSDNLRPFLISKEIDPATNKKRKGIIFGYVERLSHSSDPSDIRTLHTMLRLGRENRWKGQLDTRLADIEAKLLVAPQEEERSKHLRSTIQKRITDALNASALTDRRSYSIAISPLQPTEVQTLLSSSEESITTLLEKPLRLRPNGWGVQTGNTARLISGELRRSKVDQYSVLELFRDGTLLFSCRADEPFLAFNVSNARINPVALIESTYLFFELYRSVFPELSPHPISLLICIQFCNLNQNGLITSLSPFEIDFIHQDLPHYRHEAPDNDFSLHFSIDSSSYDTAKVAFQTIREIYGWFGIEQDKIPYLTNDLTAVDPEKIKSLH